MHNQNIKPNVLCLVNRNLTKSLEELIVNFDFNLIFYENNLGNINNLQYHIMIADTLVLEDKNILNFFISSKNVENY